MRDNAVNLPTKWAELSQNGHYLVNILRRGECDSHRRILAFDKLQQCSSRVILQLKSEAHTVDGKG